jgi:hypothetical protein
MNDYVYVIVMPEKRIPRGMSKIGHLLLKKGQIIKLHVNKTSIIAIFYAEGYELTGEINPTEHQI